MFHYTLLWGEQCQEAMELGIFGSSLAVAVIRSTIDFLCSFALNLGAIFFS